jgi:hypothetical protein
MHEYTFVIRQNFLIFAIFKPLTTILGMCHTIYCIELLYKDSHDEGIVKEC